MWKTDILHLLGSKEVTKINVLLWRIQLWWKESEWTHHWSSLITIDSMASGWKQRRQIPQAKEKWQPLGFASPSGSWTHRSSHVKLVWKVERKCRFTRETTLPGFRGQRNRPQMELCGLLPSPWLGWVPAICLHLSVQKAESSPPHTPSNIHLHHPPTLFKIHLILLSYSWVETSYGTLSPPKAARSLL